MLGATIHDVAQVVGAGYSISPQTGDIATYVKLLRVTMLLPVVFSIAFAVRRASGGANSGARANVPLFLIGFACLVAAACYGFTFVYMVRFLTGRGLSPLRLAAGQLLAGTVIAALVLPLLGAPVPHLRADALIAAAILGTMGTGVAYRINYRLLVDEGASATSIVTYLMPIVSVVLGAAALGELIPLNVIIGMLMVLAGVALARRRATLLQNTR